MKKFALSLLCLSFLFPAAAYAKRDHDEKWYRNQWCTEHHGKQDVVLADKTKVDCLIKSHAIAFGFGDKWEEALGQALYYGLQTGRTPGVVLILENVKEGKYWIRLNNTIQHFNLPIDTWSTGKRAE